LIVESTDTVQMINPTASANANNFDHISGHTRARCHRRNNP
jgi:hypothetical protein